MQQSTTININQMTLLTLKLCIFIYTLYSGYHLLCWSPKSQMISLKADLPSRQACRKRHLSMPRSALCIISVDKCGWVKTHLFSQNKTETFKSMQINVHKINFLSNDNWQDGVKVKNIWENAFVLNSSAKK